MLRESASIESEIARVVRNKMGINHFVSGHLGLLKDMICQQTIWLSDMRESVTQAALLKRAKKGEISDFQRFWLSMIINYKSNCRDWWCFMGLWYVMWNGWEGKNGRNFNNCFKIGSYTEMGDDDGTCEQSIKKLTYVPTCAHTSSRPTNWQIPNRLIYQLFLFTSPKNTCPLLFWDI